MKDLVRVVGRGPVQDKLSEFAFPATVALH